MIAGIYNVTCQQGSTFTRVIRLKMPDPADPTQTTYVDYDLEGHTARMQVRRTISSTTAQVELTTENGRILIEPAGEKGIIRLNLTDEETAALTSDGVYDLEIISAGGVVSRVIQGTFTLSLEVTR
ncbi:MAG: hypothetical protein O3A30_03860 [Bacteroidetes bacterium]|nr:hypothetical protein [Bacteroidota bacterium]